jgi:aspartyl-tRNA(Asn)/glutamyl-tRNA(Gln) amidotransferase subunit A
MDLPLTIKDAAAALRAKQLSSVELTSGLLARIKELNPTVGAFITVTEESALAAAAAADADFAGGVDRGPLQGIPYAPKDIIATKDAPTTGNSVVLDRAWGEGRDAPVIARLRDTGAVLVGKTVLNEFAMGMPDPSRMVFPMPKNPWDLERSAAGSSSGTGVAVAAGLVLAGLGTDTGGSTRLPASWNGVSGMKQTHGLVPKWGCVPLGYSLDAINPMARSAYDCALILNVIAGYDARDLTSVDVPVPDYTATLTGDVNGLRIGLPTEYFYDTPDLDPEMKAAVLAGVEMLRSAGAEVREVDLPHGAEAKEAAMLLLYMESFAYHRDDLAARYNDYSKFTAESLTRGLFLGGSDLVQANRFRSYWKKKVAEVMTDLDVLITPTSIAPAALRAGMSTTKQLGSAMFTPQWNLTGQPAMAIPCGFSASGLPLSMQIIGRPFEEQTVFQVADAYQRITDWHLRVPPSAVPAVA